MNQRVGYQAQVEGNLLKSESFGANNIVVFTVFVADGTCL